MTFQPRYIAYCRAHGMTPEAMLAQDKTSYPGGCMCGFILWVGAQWRTFERAYGVYRNHKTLDDHARFDAWLSA